MKLILSITGFRFLIEVRVTNKIAGNITAPKTKSNENAYAVLGAVTVYSMIPPANGNSKRKKGAVSQNHAL